MKKFISVILSVLVVVLIFAGCSKTADSITFKSKELTMEIDESVKIEYAITPEDMKNPEIEWASSNDSVVKVDEEGNVTALKDGEAEITATSGDTAKDSCKIKVMKKETFETEGLKIEGVYVDKSYTTKESSTKKLVYVFYEVSSTGSNFSIDAKSLNITIGDTNQYKSVRSLPKYVPNYYDGAYLKSVNVGESLKVVETFEIPEADLAPGKIITFEKSEVEGFKNLSVRTDSIIECKDEKAVAKKADPKGYKAEMDARKDADAKTISKVKREIDGYQWDFYMSSLHYELEFYDGNKYQLRTNLGTTVDGKISIKKGYIILVKDGKTTAQEIPYSFENGQFKLDISTAFDPGK